MLPQFVRQSFVVAALLLSGVTSLSGQMPKGISDAGQEKKQSELLEESSDTVTAAAGLPSDDDERPAMELGGVVTLDAGIDPEKANETEMEVGEVELSALVNVSGDVVAAITIKADNGLQNLMVDEAVVEWKVLEPVTFLLGQQTFHHALLSSHLISDPSITDILKRARE